jgi:hypothetical protein
MANEYLKRTPTSSGNRKVFTWSVWVKKTENSGGFGRLFESGAIGNRTYFTYTDFDELRFSEQASSSNRDSLVSNYKLRDSSSICHVMIAVNSTLSKEDDRVKIYINGSSINNHGFSTDDPPALNALFQHNEAGEMQYIGNSANQAADFKGYMSDVFMVDGQALEPDLFGFYKDGDGYMSSGSTQATDFRPGQWIPHAPRVIKKSIERRGGFGANGFYLPMNSSNNPGADFHCVPDTILKLKEDLPQPKAEIDGTEDYTGALRDDPFKDYLVLAVPGVIGGKQDGYGDYSGDIKGSGTNKTTSGSGNFAMTNFSSYYGSVMTFSGSGNSTSDGGLVSIAPSPDFNLGLGDFTLEGWINAHVNAQDSGVFGVGSGGAEPFLSFTSGTLRFRGNGGGIYITNPNTVAIEQWHHVALESHNTVISLIVNGVVVGTANNSHSFSEGSALIGSWTLSRSYGFNGDIQDVRLYKGIAKYKGGFDVPKPYTPVGIEAFRTTADTCKNNFATLNPLDTTQLSATNGNLSIDQSSGGWHSLLGTHYARSGKWYTEMRIDRLGWIFFGVEQTWLQTSTKHIGGQSGSKGAGLVYNTGNRGDITYNAANNAYTGGDATASTGDIISIALDLDSNNVKFYKNNVLQYNLNDILESGADYTFGVSPYNSVAATVNFGQNPSFSGQVTAGTNADHSGKGLFKYAPPAGFLALCEDNLPTPAIADPGKYFKSVLWSGDSNSGRSITGVGFQPDLVWLKSRTNNASNRLSDAVRGVNKQLMSNSTEAEVTFTTMLTSFDSDGFTLGDNVGINGSGYTNVAWCWKAGGAAVSNTDGSITSQVSVNQDAGFSIVSYDGAGSNSNTGHGLSKTPDFILWKAREDTYNWDIYHSSLGYQSSLIFTNAATRNVLHAAPTSTTIPVTHTYTGGSASGKGMIAYCWTEIEGFSRFGSYIGNQNADGPFVYCGFKPAFVLIKDTTLNPSSWILLDSSRDSVNPCTHKLFPNYSGEENVSSPAGATSSTNHVDLLSNGFKLRSSNSWSNYSDTYIFAAFAESPFQTANAK